MLVLRNIYNMEIFYNTMCYVRKDVIHPFYLICLKPRENKTTQRDIRLNVKIRAQFSFHV